LARTWLAGFFREPSAMVVLADGKMRFIPASTDPEVLRTLFSIEKGEPLRLQLPWYAVLDRPSHRTLILGCLLISLALVAASVGVVCRLYRNKTVWPAEMLLFIIGTQQFFFLFAFFAAYQFEVLPALPPGIQREGLMLRVMPAFAGAFAALCALLQFGEVKRQRAWFGLLVLVLTAFFLASWSVDRSWTAEESLTTIGCPITMALAALVFAAVTPRQSTSTPGKGTWHWLSLIAALVPMVWFGLWWHWGLVEPRVPFLLVLD